MSTATKEKTEVFVAPFGIEIDAPKNNDVLIQAIPGCLLRGAVRARAGVRTMPLIPDIPGMQLHVNPAKLIARIVDPLNDDSELCELIRTTIKNDTHVDANLGDVLKGVPDRDEPLDVDRMKTLCQEMVDLIDSDHAKIVKGPKPSEEDIAELPGDTLLDPGCDTTYGRPKYAKDLPAWQRRQSVGGR